MQAITPCIDTSKDEDDDFLTAAMGEMIDAFYEILESHELNSFPISPKHKMQVIDWLHQLLEAEDISIKGSNLETLIRANASFKAEEPEFVFKTFLRSASPVTLLEENKNFIGHGTTGLTSWQAAIFLNDWAQNNLKIFQVHPCARSMPPRVNDRLSV